MATATATAERKGGGGGFLVLVIVVVVVAVLASAVPAAPPRVELIGQVEIGGLGTVALRSFSSLELPEGAVDVSNPHAVLRHGVDEVIKVRAAMAAMAKTEPIFFGQGPCKDGIYRFILGFADGSFGIWVLQKVGPSRFIEKTAFTTRDTNYVHTVRDDCGNGGYWGHAYGS